MRHSSKKSSILAILISINIFYSCSTPTTKEEVSTIGPAKNKTPVEIVNVQGSLTPSSSSTPTAKPTISPSSTPTPSVALPSINPAAPTTYMIPLSVKTGTATAYLTYTSNTYGKVLVNFKNLGDIPNKIQLLDQFGNVINTSKTFNVAIAGNSVFTFYKQATQKVNKIQLFFVNDSMVEDTMSDTPSVVASEPSPEPSSTPKPTPIPTPTPTPIIPSNQWTVSTFAGSGVSGFADGTGTNAQFYNPQGIAMDSSGNVFVADRGNNRIRKITLNGGVTTIAGDGTIGIADGIGANAQFYSPFGIDVDNNGNVFVADSNNNEIRKITPDGVVTTFAGTTGGFADGTGTNARFFYPNGVTVDNNGNVFVADTDNNKIRKITPDGVVTTFAGSTYGSLDGLGANARFYSPFGIDVDSNGNIFVADTYNNRIRKITPDGVVTTFAGSSQGFADGTGTNAKFYKPFAIKVDSSGNIFVADTYNYKIRKITPDRVVTTIAGTGTAGFADGTGTNAKFNLSYGITISNSGVIYVSDANNKIRKITPIP